MRVLLNHVKRPVKPEILEELSDMEETSLGQLKVPVKPDAEAFHDEGDLMESPLGTPRICGWLPEEPKPTGTSMDDVSTIGTNSHSSLESTWSSSTVDGWNGNYKRVQKRQRDEQGLQQFLKQFGFQNCTASKIHRHGAFRTEEIYPIHVAARLGNYPLLRLLVCRGADPQQKSSQNRVPMDFAWEREDLDTEGQQIMDFLKSKTKIVSMREFQQMMK